MGLPRDLLAILVCPLCRKPVREEGNLLICENGECNLRYPVRDSIPIMLIDEADRPCPSCGKQRTWEKESLSCPSCKTTFKAPR